MSETSLPPAERDWLEVLRDACARSSQSQTARRLGVSATMVNQALKGSYRSPTTDLEARVRARLMATDIECPALGCISTARCDVEQRAEFSSANPVAIRRYRACRAGCPRYRGAPAQKGGAR